MITFDAAAGGKLAVRSGADFGFTIEADDAARQQVLPSLNGIATAYWTSRRLEEQGTSRPDSNPTLKAVSAMAEKLCLMFESIPSEARAALGGAVDVSAFADAEPGLPHLKAIAAAVVDVEDIALLNASAAGARAILPWMISLRVPKGWLPPPGSSGQGCRA